MTNQIVPAVLRATDRNGEPQAAAKAWYYETGTMNAVTVTDRAGNPLPWPVEADLNGIFVQRFYGGALALKEILTDADDVILPGWPVDPVIIVAGVATGAASISFVPTDQAPSLDVQGALEDLSALAKAQGDMEIDGTGLATVSGDVDSDFVVDVPIATPTEAQAGASNAVAMTPATTKDAITEFALTFSGISANQTITSAGLITWAHGLDHTPVLVALFLKCLIVEAGWAVGDLIAASLNNTTTATNRAMTWYADDANVYFRFTDAPNCFVVPNKTTGVPVVLTNANWALKLRAW